MPLLGKIRKLVKPLLNVCTEGYSHSAMSGTDSSNHFAFCTTLQVSSFQLAEQECICTQLEGSLSSTKMAQSREVPKMQKLTETNTHVPSGLHITLIIHKQLSTSHKELRPFNRLEFITIPPSCSNQWSRRQTGWGRAFWKIATPNGTTSVL